jgi:predicted enzyme related to lactoylglutathione lyase
MQFQILSNQPEKTADFYSQLFDWSINTDNALGYREINTGTTEGIQGGIWPAPPEASTFTQLFIVVEDLEAKSAAAQSLGAQTLIPPTVLPDGGAVSILLDPTGMPFAIWRKPNNDKAGS